MKAAQISENVWRIGANLSSAELFEGIWPIPYGVSVNSYIVKGEKTALIDLVKDCDNAAGTYLEQLKEIGDGFDTIDYLILNHMEPDHTGYLAKVKEDNPDMKIYCTKKAAALVQAFYKITEDVIIVGSGDTLDLGGKTLVFEETPNIHWPETMMTYCPEDKILFSCDAFGSFGAVADDKVFDDQMNDEDMEFFRSESLRYYANIVSTFSGFVNKGIAKLSGLDIGCIAPSHGPVWRSNPEVIVKMYQEFASYLNGPAENHITIIWSSMYGNTASMLETVIQALEDKKVSYSIFKIPRDHVSFVLADVWKSRGLIIGMPTYEYKMFPPMAHAIDIFDRSHVKNKKVFRFGSYGWSGGAQKQFDEMTAKLKWDYLDPVEWQGAPEQEDKDKTYEQVCKLVEEISAL